MSEEPTTYQAGQINRLRRIEYWLKRYTSLPIDDQRWLISEVKRLQTENEDLKLQVAQLAEALELALE